MNPLLQAALGSLIRFALGGVFSYLVTKGIWTEAEAANYLSAAVVALVALGWAIWSHYKDRLKLVTALATPHAASEHLIERMVADGQAPPTTLPKNTTPYLAKPPYLATPPQPPGDDVA